MNKMKQLVDYMKKRATYEGVEWSLTDGFLQAHFNRGVRTFFGVEIDGDGALLRDEQQPMFFDKFCHAARS